MMAVNFSQWAAHTEKKRIKSIFSITVRKNIRKTLVSLSLIASLVVTGVSVNQSAKMTAQAAKKTVVKISKTSVKVKHGKTQTLKVTVKNGKLKSKVFLHLIRV